MATNVRAFRPTRWALDPTRTERKWAPYWRHMVKVWDFNTLDRTLSNVWPHTADLPAPIFGGSSALVKGDNKIRSLGLDSPTASSNDFLEYAGNGITFACPQDAGTVCMLVQPNTAAAALTFRGFMSFSNKGLGGSTANFQLHINQNDTLTAGWVAASSARIFLDQAGNFDWNAGDRFLLTVTWDRRGTSLYKDGEFLASTTLSSTGDTASGGGDNRIYIGSNHVPANRAMGGHIHYMLVARSKWSHSMVKQLSVDPFGPLRMRRQAVRRLVGDPFIVQSDAVAVGVAATTKGVGVTKAATATGILGLLRNMSIGQAMIAIGVVGTQKDIGVTLPVTATGVPALTRGIGKLTAITATGVTVLVKGIAKTFAILAGGVVTIVTNFVDSPMFSMSWRNRRRR